MPKSDYREDIQVLRGLAVILVIAFHLYPQTFRSGYLGVDIFFVISGFVVTPLMLNILLMRNLNLRISKLRIFYKKRIFRLFPSLSVTIFSTSLLTVFFGMQVDHFRVGALALTSLLGFGNIGAYKYSGDYFHSNLNPLSHTWSLSLESQIYFLIPLSLLILIRNATPKKVKLAFIAITISSLLVAVNPQSLAGLNKSLGIQNVEQFSYYSFFSRLWEFLLGGLLYLSPKFLYKVRGKKHVASKFASYIIFPIGFFYAVNAENSNTVQSSIFACIWTALMIRFKLLEYYPNKLNQILENIGSKSYSLYLVHLPIIYIAGTSPITNHWLNDRAYPRIIFLVSIIWICGNILHFNVEMKYRFVQSTDAWLVAEKRRIIAMILLPLCASTFMLFGSQNHYWGIDKNLTPPIYPGFADSQCERDSKNGPPCFYINDQMGKTVILVGDSHAAHYSDALISAAKSLKWNVIIWTHSGCPIQFKSNSVDMVSKECILQNSRLLDELKELQPDAVIVSQFVHSYSNLQELKSALTKIKRVKSNLLLIGNNPIFPDKDKYMSQGLLFGKKYNPPKSFKVSKMITVDKPYSDALLNWANTKGIQTFDPTSLFCNQTSCRRNTGGKWLYVDDGHLSDFGASLIQPKFKEFLGD